jgi:outer membrane lipopolysaccharide assembly protein LptE/RlpB
MLLGCGYTLQGSGSVLPPDVKTIYVAPVENNSTELGLSDVLTEALREEFDGYGVVSVVDRQSEADAVLKAKITAVKKATQAVRSVSNTAVQMNTTMNISAELRRTSGGVLWRMGDMKVSKSFGTDASVVVASSADFASGSISSSNLSSLSTREVARGQEKEVLRSLSEELARQVYAQAVSPDF